MAITNDPKPVLRQELARVFKNQRVIRAFEQIFDLIPPEFINQQQLIEAISLVAESASTQANEAAAAIERLASSLDRLAVAPPTSAPIDQWLDTRPPSSLSFQSSLSDLLPPPIPAVVADPTASVGLTAVVGTADSFMRSDAAPPISQAIAPTWTAKHTFSKSFGAAGDAAIHLSSAIPIQRFTETGAGADEKEWYLYTFGDQFRLQSYTDDLTTASRDWLKFTRTGVAATTMEYGNTTDNPAHNFRGTIGFNGTNAIAKPTVTGSKGGNAALTSLLTALANYGLVTDSST